MVVAVYVGFPSIARVKILTLDFSKDLEDFSEAKWTVEAFEYFESFSHFLPKVLPFVDNERDQAVIAKLKDGKFGKGFWVVCSTEIKNVGTIKVADFQFSTPLDISIGIRLAVHGSARIRVSSPNVPYALYDAKVERKNMEHFLFCSVLIFSLPPVDQVSF